MPSAPWPLRNPGNNAKVGCVPHDTMETVFVGKDRILYLTEPSKVDIDIKTAPACPYQGIEELLVPASNL